MTRTRLSMTFGVLLFGVSMIVPLVLSRMNMPPGNLSAKADQKELG
jgi:hypothetical protein